MSDDTLIIRAPEKRCGGSLVPCPFCEGKGKTCHINDSSGIYTHAVVCTKCGASGPLGKSEKEAEELWNTRDERMCEVDEDGMCTACHREVASEVVGDNEVVYAKFCGECGAKVVGA